MRGKVLGALIACAIAWGSFGSDRALAQEALPRLRHALGGELSYFADDDVNSSIDLLLVQLDGRYVWNERIHFTGVFGIATLVSTPARGDGDVIWRPSNPEVMAFYRIPLQRPIRLVLGLGVSGPLATITRGPDARLHRTALSYAQAGEGLSRMWRWAPNRTTAISSLDLQMDLHRIVTLGFELTPALLIPSREDYYTESFDLIVPTAVALMLGSENLRIGLRAHEVFMPTFDVDEAQFSLEPFALLHLGRLLVDVRSTINVDEPLAGSRGPGSWAMHLRVGGEL